MVDSTIPDSRGCKCRGFLALAVGWLHERWGLESRFQVWKEKHFQSLVDDNQHMLGEIEQLREENWRLSLAAAMLSEDHGDNDEQESGLIIFPRRDRSLFTDTKRGQVQLVTTIGSMLSSRHAKANLQSLGMARSDKLDLSLFLRPASSK